MVGGMTNKKKGPGRPEKPLKERKLPFSVRFTPPELKDVKRLAKEAALPVSVYVHDRALKLV